MDLKPVIQSLWLADDATQDESGKVTIHGLFDLIEVEEPAREFTSGAYLFFALREIHGSTTITLRYTHVDSDRLVLERSQTIPADSPLETVDVAIPLPSIPVPEEGSYMWELFWGEDALGSLRCEARYV